MLRAVAGGGSSGGGGFTVGQAITGGTPSSLVYEDASGNIATSSTIPFIVTNTGLTTTSPGWYAQITGDAFPRVRVGLNAADVASVAFGGGAGARDLFLERAGAASLRLGAADAAAPVAQTLSVQSVLAGTSNTSGVNFTLNLSQSTGTGEPGAFIIKGAAKGSSGTSVNALGTIFQVEGAGTGLDTGTLWIGQATPSATNYTVSADASGTTINSATAAGGVGFYGANATPFGAFRTNASPAVSGFEFIDAAALMWSSTGAFSGAPDLTLFRDAANTSAQRNGVNPQTKRIYGSYTDASNNDYLNITKAAGGDAVISTAKNGTGTAGNLGLTATTIIITGLPKFAGTNSTGAGSALLGANSPASTLTAPYTWITVTASDGSTGYMPVWK